MSRIIQEAKKAMREAFAADPNSAADVIIAMIFGENENEEWVPSSSEALYSFTSWLTTRKEKVVLSSEDYVSPVKELVEQFCEVNNLPVLRDGWAEHLTHPAKVHGM